MFLLRLNGWLLDPLASSSSKVTGHATVVYVPLVSLSEWRSLAVPPHDEVLIKYDQFPNLWVENCLTPAVSGRRPDESFHVQREPPTGGGHEHGVG